MKNWLRSTAGKAVCFILCILMLILALAGFVGGIAMIAGEFYITPIEVMTDQAYGSIAYSHANDIITAIDAGIYHNRFDAPYTNLRYKVVSSDGKTVETNITGNPARPWLYAFYQPRENHYFVEAIDPTSDPVAEVLTIYLYVDPQLPASDQYALATAFLQFAYALRTWIWIIAAAALLLNITCFILLMAGAGRRPHSRELHPGPLHRVPFDLLVIGTATLLLTVYAAATDAFYYNKAQVPIVAIWLVLCACASIGLCMSMAVRVKDKTLLRNTLAGKFFRLIGRLFRAVGTLVKNLPLIWRTALLVLALGFFDFLTHALSRSPISVPFWLIQNLLLAGGLLYAALFMRRLQAGGDALARGDLNYKVDTSIMFGDFRQHGENLNSIALGMNTAVEQRLRSERMKTELITNVSHDIKTPLTSIINYATLIGQTPCDNAQHTEYAEVLIRKSGHLRRLLDDLVEISRASTGNLEVELAPCDACVLLTQAAGEFEQRCTAAGLELLTSQPEQPVMILADSRRIWRVFENLMSNACKYSLPGTRVFLRLETVGQEAVIIFRNTASTVLNISPEALMERFVRGDEARSTEGSGLGLSIAQSLTQLQGGQMDITIDGDLFKVTLRFPLV